MKPKFALDLSHEGINLLHRSKGGWSLVGSVDLDDPDMGAHLADLRRRAAALESGGLTCKIIIPNSQVLYTTLEAPGPDDISREVQIRSGLDGLTPYPVGELVFDWRAAGERARVAVLARETMDEAETFAVEHRFNPVSFVARSPQGEFSGEPFFGKTRAATKILGPTERVEPDASPVPRKPPAIDPRPAPGSGPTGASDRARAPAPDPRAGPHSPAELSWQPPAEPAPDPAAHGSRPDRPAAPAPQEVPEPQFDPVDDPFAELDAIQAELSGNPDAMPAFRPRDNRPRTRPAQSARGADSGADRRTGQGADPPAPPPLAPFPPTSDDTDAMPAPAQPGRKPRASGKPAAPARAPASAPDAGREPATRRPTATGAKKATSPGAAGQPARPPARDDTPAQPGVAFSTRRGDNGATTTATPSAHGTATGPAQGTPHPAPRSAPQDSRAQPTGRDPRSDTAPDDRRRADMAEALSRPLPGTPSGGGSAKPPEKPGPRGSLSDAVRGAAGGLRSFGQRRASGRREAGPADTSMAALMRGAGSSGARISPDQYADDREPRAEGAAQDKAQDAAQDTAQDAARDGAQVGTQAGTRAAARAGAQDTPGAATQPATAKAPATDPAAARPDPATAPATGPSKTPPSAPPSTADRQAPEPAIPPAGEPAPATAPGASRVPAGAPVAKPHKASGAASEAEALTVFGARRTEETRGGRKYLGLVLTLLLLLAMAIIAMWSSFIVDDGDPAVLPPSEDAAAPETPALPETTPQTAPPDATQPETDTDTPPEETAPEETAPEAAASPDPETAPVPQVLTREEADALYAETQVWQRAPETPGEPATPGLESGPVDAPGTARGATADPAAAAEPGPPAAPGGDVERAAPLPPPPADTVFELDENGLVIPSPDGTVSPSGIIIFEGAPAAVPPERPAPPALPDAAPGDAGPDDAALEQAVDQAVEAAAALATETPPADALPDAPGPDPAEPDPADPDATAPEAAAPEAADPDEDARLDGAPADTPVDPATATAPAEATPDVTTEATAEATTEAPADAEIQTAAADPASIEDAVDAAATNFVDASDLAVARSVKPSRRPADIDDIVRAAKARAAAAPPEPAAPATTTPAIPTSASVAERATTPNAIDLREINLLGISGPTNARRALVRMENGRYITVKVGDRLDGGRVTSITSDGLTYQKGARNYTLQLLPLG